STLPCTPRRHTPPRGRLPDAPLPADRGSDVVSIPSPKPECADPVRSLCRSLDRPVRRPARRAEAEEDKGRQTSEGRAAAERREADPHAGRTAAQGGGESAPSRGKRTRTDAEGVRKGVTRRGATPAGTSSQRRTPPARAGAAAHAGAADLVRASRRQSRRAGRAVRVAGGRRDARRLLPARPQPRRPPDATRIAPVPLRPGTRPRSHRRTGVRAYRSR